MSDALIDRLSALSPARRRFAAGAFLFRQDDPVRVLMLIEAGEVHLVRYQPDGACLTLQRAGPGAVLAEASLFSPRYHCDGVAARPAVVLTIDAAAVRRALAADPALAAAWSAHLAREVQAARLRAEILSLRGVGARLDAWRAAHGGALPAKGGWRAMAAEIAVSPEALYRELARRRRTGAP